MPVSRAVLSLAVPTVISQLITVVYNMADTFFIGQLNDPGQVAAATVAMPLFMFLTGIANLFGLGGSSLISRSLGEGDKKRAVHCSSFCIWGGIIVALFYGIIVYLLCPILLPLLGANETTYSYTKVYVFWTILIGSIPTVMNALMAHLIRSEGYSSQASFGVAMGGILNIILDPIFIFTFHLNVQGAAIATMVSNLIAMIYFFSFIYIKRKQLVITPSLKYFTFKYKIPSEVIAVGLPGFIMTFMATLSNSTLNSLVASHSNEAIAGMGIAKKIDLLAYAIAQGMAQGVLPLIGYNYTARNYQRMNKAIKTTFAYSLIIACIGALFLFIGAKPIIHCFINNQDTVHYGQTFLRIICLACPSTSINFMIITIFQASGKKIQPLILSLLRKGGLDIPLMFLFNALFSVNGIAWATPAADIIALVISLLIFIPYKKQLTNKS